MTELLPAADVAPRTAPAPPPGAPPLRVMTFNVRFGAANDGANRWELRRDLLVRTILAYGPDLLGVQEALDFQADELKDALRDYAFHGAGREDGKCRGEFCPVYYRRDRFERLDAGNFWLSESPDVPGSRGWDAELPRMASWVKLRDRLAAEAGPLLFCNTHWDHAGKHARFESARLLRRRMRLILPAGPLVLVGDFNAREDDEEYAELLRSTHDDGPKLVDSYRKVHPDRITEEASFHGFKGGREGIRIDWVLHSEELAAVEACIDHTSRDGRYPSDHFPVTAMLVRRPAPEKV